VNQSALIRDTWENCQYLLAQGFESEAGTRLRVIFESLIQMYHSDQEREPLPKRKNGQFATITDYIKKIEKKDLRNRCHSINHKLSPHGHQLKVDDDVIQRFEEIVNLARQFGMILPWEPPVEKKGEGKRKAKRLGVTRGGPRRTSPEELVEKKGVSLVPTEQKLNGFGSRPHQCPHCENYIGYLRGSAPKHFGPSSLSGRGSFGWLVKHDRNYCPFCLFEEWLPEYKGWARKEIGESINRPSKLGLDFDIGHIERELDSIIRVNSIDINNPREFQERWISSIGENYFYEGGLMWEPREDTEEDDERWDSEDRRPLSEEEALGRHVLRIFFEASGENSMNIIDFRKLWETGLFGYAKDGHQIKWDDSDGYMQMRGVGGDEIEGVPRSCFAVDAYLEKYVNVIPKMYRNFLDFRLVPFSSDRVSIDVIPNNKIRRGEEINLEEIEQRGVHKTLYEVFAREGDPIGCTLTSDEIIDGIWELNYTLVTDTEDYHELDKLSIEEQLDLIPDYCKNYLFPEIENGKVHWLLVGDFKRSEPLS